MEFFDLSFQNPIYPIDATVVDLCLNAFWWGKFRKHKAAVKLHTMHDIRTQIPAFIHVAGGNVHEVNILDVFSYDAGSYYLMDKGYVDFGRLYRMHQSGAFYVTRAKQNLTFVRVSSRKVDKSTGVKCDQSVRLKNKLVSLAYPENIRRVKYVDKETQKEFVFITIDF